MRLNQSVGSGVLLVMTATAACGGLVAPGTIGSAEPTHDAGTAQHDAGHPGVPAPTSDASVGVPPAFDAGVIDSDPGFPPAPPLSCAAAEPTAF